MFWPVGSPGPSPTGGASKGDPDDSTGRNVGIKRMTILTKVFA